MRSVYHRRPVWEGIKDPLGGTGLAPESARRYRSQSLTPDSLSGFPFEMGSLPPVHAPAQVTLSQQKHRDAAAMSLSPKNLTWPCVSFLLCYCDKMPDRSSLKKGKVCSCSVPRGGPTMMGGARGSWSRVLTGRLVMFSLLSPLCIV